MKAASHNTTFPHPWQHYRGHMFTQNNSSVTSLMCWAQAHFSLPWACCTSIPTCFFNKHTYCVRYRELPVASFLKAASVSVSIYLTEEPDNSGEHFWFEWSLNFQSITFGDQWQECGQPLRADMRAVGVMFVNFWPFLGDSSKPLSWKRPEWNHCGFAWMNFLYLFGL